MPDLVISEVPDSPESPEFVRTYSLQEIREAALRIEDAEDQSRLAPKQNRTPSGGRASKKRQKATLQLLERLRRETRRLGGGRWDGPLRPCTVVNFNPEDLVLEGCIRLTVPGVNKPSKSKMRISHEGREFAGNYVVIASPVVYLRAVGHIVDPQLNIDVPDMEPAYYSPHSIGCELWAQYVEGSAYSKLMGGVLLFDGDAHSLSETNLARTEGRIWVPKQVLVDDDPHPVFELRETALLDEVERILTMQRAYCDMKVQVAHSLHVTNDPMQQASITNTMRDWARYAVAKFWMKDLPEWVKANITATGPVLSLVRCKGCGTQQPNDDVYMCKGCNAPYDTYKAFKAGVLVPQGYLDMLEGEELDEVRKTLEERRNKFKGTKPSKQSETTPPPPVA